jgi:hypothetical protein
VTWPGLLTSEEVHVIAGLCGWLTDDSVASADLTDPYEADDEDDDDEPYYDEDTGDWHA